MKKNGLIVIVLCLSCFLFVNCKQGNGSADLSARDSVFIKMLHQIAQEPNYKLYRTDNMYISILLNTVNGSLSLVQWSIEDDSRLRCPLDGNSRLPEGATPVSGRFSLHPTDNMYNFILLDNVDGRTWQVQWSIEEDKRFVIPISL